jgi:hypothetical protein
MMMNPLGLMLGAKSLEWSYYKIPRNQTLNNRIAFAALFSSSVQREGRVYHLASKYQWILGIQALL